MIKWNSKSFEWLLRASDYTGYNRKLAEILFQHIEKTDTLCDLGCGMALTDMELAGKIGHITCIDRDRSVIDYVRDRAADLEISNIDAKCLDARTASGKWDTVMSIFHGEAEDFAQLFLPLADDRFIAVVHGKPEGKLGPKRYRAKKLNYAEMTADTFDKLGISYSGEEFKLEFGQPLLDMKDASEFVKTYSLNPSEIEVEEYLEKELVKLSGGKYPLYLPNEKHFAVFVIRRQENEDICRRCAPGC